MTKRLNDVAAVQAMIPYESQSEHYSKSVRKIDNGYVIREFKHGPNCPDGPIEKEVFVRDHPDLKDASNMDGNGGAMKRAVEFMNKK
jgi:hypothetical protein